MHHEFLDVVDDHDKIIGRCSRPEIHASSLRHRAIHILVFNDHGQLFLQKRSMKKDLNKGLWDSSAAGHVDADESYDDCATRELQEELGIKAELKFLFKLDATAELGMEFIQIYKCLHNGPFVFARDEIEEGIWQSLAKVTERVHDNDPTLTESFKIIWHHFMQHPNI